MLPVISLMLATPLGGKAGSDVYPSGSPSLVVLLGKLALSTPASAFDFSGEAPRLECTDRVLLLLAFSLFPPFFDFLSLSLRCGPSFLLDLAVLDDYAADFIFFCFNFQIFNFKFH